MRWLCLFLSLVTFSSAFKAGAQAEAPRTVRENYVFTMKDFAPLGPHLVSWFFLRENFLWTNGFVLNLERIEWPQWDSSQVPISLLPVSKQKADILIFNEEKSLIDTIPLSKAFSPEAYVEKVKPEARFYKIRMFLDKDRVVLTSGYYAWYERTKLSSCQLEVSSEKFSRSRGIFNTCLSALRAILENPSAQKQQTFVEIQLPPVSGREKVIAIKDFERELRSLTKKAKGAFFTRKISGEQLKVDFGLTHIEKLPKISFPFQSLPLAEKVIMTPDAKTIKQSLQSFSAADGAELEIYAFSSDKLEVSNLTSPMLGIREINLQVDRGLSQEEEIQLVSLRAPEVRTGILGFLRNWSVLIFTDYNILTSHLGEKSSMLSFPGFSLRYNWEFLGAQPFLDSQLDQLHLGSPFSINEVKAGIEKKLPWFDSWFGSLGLQRYVLAGQNEGANRLGSIQALTAGLGLSHKFENWVLREKVNILVGNQIGFDGRVDFGRYLKGPETGQGYYLGGFLGYSLYRGRAVSGLGITDIYSEQRVQIGFIGGWLGLESF